MPYRGEVDHPPTSRPGTCYDACDTVRSGETEERMTEPAHLVELLGGEPPPGVAALPAADRAVLAEVIGAAQREQDEALAAAFYATLRHLPFPLRVVVRKVLFG